MSRYRSSCCSRRCSSCGVELRLFFTPGEADELRREQGGAVAQAERRSLLRFMEAAAARQGTATMARQPGPSPRAAFPAARAPGATQRWPAAGAKRARPGTLLPGRPSLAGRGSRGPPGGMFRGASFTKRRAHNPPRGPPARAVHWSVRRDVTQLRPSYRQVLGDAIKKSLSASANRAESVLATPGWDPPNFCLLCPGATPQSPVPRVSPQVPVQPFPSNSTPGLWDGIFFFKCFVGFLVIRAKGALSWPPTRGV